MLDSFEVRNAMRGEDERSEGLFSYVRLDTRIPADHPLRAIRALIDEALTGLSRDFNKLYARAGRRSRRSGCCGRCCCKRSTRCARSGSEQLDYNLLFRWFVGLSAVSSCPSWSRISNSARKLEVPEQCAHQMIRCGMRRYSARTGIGCSTAISRPSSLRAC
jgi:hypothetical protein